MIATRALGEDIVDLSDLGCWRLRGGHPCGRPWTSRTQLCDDCLEALRNPTTPVAPPRPTQPPIKPEDVLDGVTFDIPIPMHRVVAGAVRIATAVSRGATS